MNIREFERPDLAEVRELIYRTIDICYKKDYCPEAIKFFKDWHRDERILKDFEEGYMIVLVENERMIATGTVTDGEIKRVFVEAIILASLVKMRNGLLIMC